MALFKVNPTTGQLDMVNTVSDDPNPILDGDLDTNGFSIVSAPGVDIPLIPGAGGTVVIGGERWPIGDGNAGEVIKTDGAGNLSWQADAGGINAVVEDPAPKLGGNLDVNGKSIVSVADGNIPITPNGTGKVLLSGLSYPTADGAAGSVVKTNGAGTLSIGTLAEAGGGTNQTTYTQGNLLYATGANTLGKLALGTAGQALVVSGANVAWGDASRCITTVYAASDTHTLNAQTVHVEIFLYDPGGGGGSGRRGAVDTDRSGGGGAASGAIFHTRMPATVLPSSFLVTIGALGTGGLAQSSDDTNGNNGTNGGRTDIDSKIYGLIPGTTARGGGGATTTGTAGASQAPSLFLGLVSTANTSAGIAGSNGTPGNSNTSAECPKGGGGGGGINAANTVGNGSKGVEVRITGSVQTILLAGGTAGTGGADGGNGNSGFTTPGLYTWSSTGGGGGGASKVAAAGKGGNGAWPGGGGGGGGASLNGFNSGAGGNGADGAAVIIEYL